MKPGKSLYPSVHRGIVRAAMVLLKQNQHPSAAFYSDADLHVLVEYAGKPDQKGDRQRGRGFHYYCAVTPKGKSNHLASPDHSYRNGLGNTAPSPRTMLETEYPLALALYHDGHRNTAMQCLSRAIHMLGDLCCPPHSCGLTYFSRYGIYHKRYEARAAALFWGGYPVTEEQSAAEKWASLSQGDIPFAAFEAALLPQNNPDAAAHTPLGLLLNQLAESGGAELKAVLGTDLAETDASITRRLTLAIRNAAAMLAVFVKHTALPYDGIREGQPLWILSPDCMTKPLLPEPVYLHWEENGLLSLTNLRGETLALNRHGYAAMCADSKTSITKFLYGQALYPAGSLHRMLAVEKNRLCAYSGNRVGHSSVLAAKTHIILWNKPMNPPVKEDAQ